MIAKTFRAATAATLGACLTVAAQPALAQDSLDDAPIVTEYHFVPGGYRKAVEILANGDKIRAEAGLPAFTYYWHMQGDSWNLLLVAPPEAADESKRFQAAREKLGIARLAPGEFQSLVASHYDTIVSTRSPAEMLASMNGGN